MIMMMYAHINLGGKCKFLGPESMTRMTCTVHMGYVACVTCLVCAGYMTLASMAHKTCMMLKDSCTLYG